jgi:hypothetical protein
MCSVPLLTVCVSWCRLPLLRGGPGPPHPRRALPQAAAHRLLLPWLQPPLAPRRGVPHVATAVRHRRRDVARARPAGPAGGFVVATGVPGRVRRRAWHGGGRRRRRRRERHSGVTREQRAVPLLFAALSSRATTRSYFDCLQGQGALLPHPVCRHRRPLPTRLGGQDAPVREQRAAFRGLWPKGSGSQSAGQSQSEALLGNSAGGLTDVGHSSDRAAFGTGT